jgi:hypothetical protein
MALYGLQVGSHSCSHVMPKKLHGGHSKNTFLAVDEQRGVAEPLEENPEELDMRCSYIPVLSTSEMSYFGTMKKRLNITLIHQ